MDEKLNSKQKIFADEYIISGNAYQSAILAGYSENYAKAQSHKMLENVGIKSYIDKRLQELEKKKIATQDEVLQYLTSVMRGEQTEQTLVSVFAGVQEIKDIGVGAKDRVKAAELLGKRYGIWSEKITVENELDVNISFNGVERDEEC